MSGFDKDRLARIRGWMQGYVDARKYAGCSALISQSGAVALDPARAGVPGSIGDFSWSGMASTFFWIDPVHDVSVIFFTQLSPSSSYPSRAHLKALVHGALT